MRCCPVPADDPGRGVVAGGRRRLPFPFVSRVSCEGAGAALDGGATDTPALGGVSGGEEVAGATIPLAGGCVASGAELTAARCQGLDQATPAATSPATTATASAVVPREPGERWTMLDAWEPKVTSPASDGCATAASSDASLPFTVRATPAARLSAAESAASVTLRRLSVSEAASVRRNFATSVRLVVG